MIPRNKDYMGIQELDKLMLLELSNKKFSTSKFSKETDNGHLICYCIWLEKTFNII